MHTTFTILLLKKRNDRHVSPNEIIWNACNVLMKKRKHEIISDPSPPIML